MSVQTLGPKQAHLIAAVRSGAYAQGMGRMVRDVCGNKEYCFLGVVGHLFGLDMGGGFLKGDDFKEIGLYNQCGSFREPVLIDGKLFYSVVDMNDGVDGQHLTFFEIADYIEQNPSNVFGVSL